MSKFFLCVGLLLTVAACSAIPSTEIVVSPSETPPPALPSATLPPRATLFPRNTPTPSPSPSLTPSPTSTPRPTSTATSSPTASLTPTASITPTYSILRAKVLEQSNCRYGPGAPYLYKYGLYPDYVIEVFGRTDRGDWVLIRAIGGTNPCWVKGSLLEIRGDVMTVQPTYIPLPQSPYYGPLTGVSAMRTEEEVAISWNPLILRAGDDHSSPIHLVEAWLCQDGELVFTPIGTNENFITVIDEPGCAEPSHGRVFGVEKHGYTYPVEIPWPALDTP